MNLWAYKWADRVMVEQFNLIGEHNIKSRIWRTGSTKKNTSFSLQSMYFVKDALLASIEVVIVGESQSNQ